MSKTPFGPLAPLQGMMQEQWWVEGVSPGK